RRAGATGRRSRDSDARRARCFGAAPTRHVLTAFSESDSSQDCAERHPLPCRSHGFHPTTWISAELAGFPGVVCLYSPAAAADTEYIRTLYRFDLCPVAIRSLAIFTFLEEEDESSIIRV